MQEMFTSVSSIGPGRDHGAEHAQRNNNLDLHFAQTYVLQHGTRTTFLSSSLLNSSSHHSSSRHCISHHDHNFTILARVKVVVVPSRSVLAPGD